MAVIRQRWRETYVSDFARGIVDELGKLEEVWAEAWRAWENSKNDTETYEDGRNDKGPWEKKKRVSTAGNPRFLEILTKISQQRMEALGMVFDVKRKQEQDRGKYGNGYEILAVVVEDRQQANQVMTLDHFRHQFIGYDGASGGGETADDLVAQQLQSLEEGAASGGNGNGKRPAKQEGNGHE